VFKTRSTRLERIDTGDYTQTEYRRFLGEIAFINRYLGDRRALRKTLFREIEDENLPEFSVLDVGAGSGELLKAIAEFAGRSGRKATLAGVDLNEISAATVREVSNDFPEISSVRGDAFKLPFADGAFDYAISSLFFHHLTDAQIPVALAEMSRVARRGIYVIDLHRHPAAYALYRLFCILFRISPLVRQDGALSILRGFRPNELRGRSIAAVDSAEQVDRILPFRIVLSRRIR
jgi:ubiquinone/menaquinone biosynthesis C-methylase UbiE